MEHSAFGVWRSSLVLCTLFFLFSLLFLLLYAVMGTWPCKNENKTTKSPERAGNFSDSAHICEVDVLCQSPGPSFALVNHRTRLASC